MKVEVCADDLGDFLLAQDLDTHLCQYWRLERAFSEILAQRGRLKLPGFWIWRKVWRVRRNLVLAVGLFSFD